MTEHTKPWPESTCVECGKRIAAGAMQICAIGGFCTWRIPVAIHALLAAQHNALEAVRDLVAPESGVALTTTTVGPTSREARERIDRTFQQVADALHAAKGGQ